MNCPTCGGETDREECDYCGGKGFVSEGAGTWGMLIPCPDCDDGKTSICLDCGRRCDVFVRED